MAGNRRKSQVQIQQVCEDSLHGLHPIKPDKEANDEIDGDMVIPAKRVRQLRERKPRLEGEESPYFEGKKTKLKKTPGTAEKKKNTPGTAGKKNTPGTAGKKKKRPPPGAEQSQGDHAQQGQGDHVQSEHGQGDHVNPIECIVSDSEDDNDQIKPSQELLEMDEHGLSGASVFAFMSIKRSGRMALKASESVQNSPRTPVNMPKSKSSRSTSAKTTVNKAARETPNYTVKKAVSDNAPKSTRNSVNTRSAASTRKTKISSPQSSKSTPKRVSKLVMKKDADNSLWKVLFDEADSNNNNSPNKSFGSELLSPGTGTSPRSGGLRRETNKPLRYTPPLDETKKTPQTTHEEPESTPLHGKNSSSKKCVSNKKSKSDQLNNGSTPVETTVTPRRTKGRPRKSILASATPKNVKISSESMTPSSNLAPKNNRLQSLRRGYKRPEDTTPYKLRKRAMTDVIDEIISDESEYAESEESEEESSEDEVEEEKSDDEEEEEDETKRSPIKPIRIRHRKQAAMPDENAEDYFLMSSDNLQTSDRTLSRLENPMMNEEMLSIELMKVSVGYETERQILMNEYRQKFSKWIYQLCNGFNLLFHGVGSKRNLLERFRADVIREYTHLVINGYFPSLTIKHILNSITEDLLDQNPTVFNNPIDHVEFIRDYYSAKDFDGDRQDLFLVIHNIDGPMLRAEKVQSVLSLLALIPNIHIIASIDHINAPLIWDQNKCSRFRWLWNDATTYEPYTEETSYENSLLVQQSGSLALSSLTHVMKSLTPNAKQIFYLLVKYQLEHEQSSHYSGMSFQDLYQRCREAFLVNSDLTLRAQLTEFRDHKLIKFKKGHDGMEYLTVPLEASMLKEFLEQQDDHDDQL
ncbi:uncharacterized protein LOC141907275 [Tubulanus polymorphus]|uniref:uncharacterized protein LOC141907275 n=1 Tax=Tubulanus polymorphus TaxID=672921 RepID=UPI003DA6BF1D